MATPDLRDELKAPVEPLLPIEKKLIGWSFGIGIALLAGLIAAPLLARALVHMAPPVIEADTATLIAGGLMVGFGTRLGAGCTSGHGVCGVARLSPRSLAATATFMVAGFLTVFVVRHLLA